MSPIIDLQRRHAEVYRIRLGDKGPKGEPRKLTDTMRITSAGRSIVGAFVDVYGGDVTEWEGQWQAYLPTDHLRILVLPGQSLTQWWERYRGSVCERRCNGELETKTGGPCLCPADVDARIADKSACSPMTRINVLCPDVAVVGTGALVTHSVIAAETLPQSIAIAEAALDRGLMVPAVLRVIEHRGRTHFIFPQLEIVGVSFNDMTMDELPAPRVHELSPGAFMEVTRASGQGVASATTTADERPALPPPPLPPPEPDRPFAAVPPLDTSSTIKAGASIKAGDAPRELNARVAKLDPEHTEILAGVLNARGLSLDDRDADKVLDIVEKQQDAEHMKRQRKANAAMSSIGISADFARHEFVLNATGTTESTGHLLKSELDAVVAAVDKKKNAK